MTKRELVEALKDVPDDAVVFCCDSQEGWTKAEHISTADFYLWRGKGHPGGWPFWDDVPQSELYESIQMVKGVSIQ